jgi:hypothetical protein
MKIATIDMLNKLEKRVKTLEDANKPKVLNPTTAPSGSGPVEGKTKKKGSKRTFKP